MESTIKKIDGKWSANGKFSKDWGILEIGLINTFFKYVAEETDVELLSTKERCKKFCLDKAKELTVNDPIVMPTNMFDEAFNNPIEQIDNFLTK
jgi:hypothetical protein